MPARVVARTPLLYSDGADPTLDRPGHVRAGSALVAWKDHLAVVQDDACFLAVIDRRSRRVRDVPFPGEVRQFDDARGNKKSKLDLEAAFITDHDKLLVALGSGSSPLRERFVLIEEPASEAPRVMLFDAPAFYGLLRSHRELSGSELNIEGAVVHGDDLVLFQRGNGAPGADGTKPVNATARIALASLLAYVREGSPLPPLHDVIEWKLPRGLTFTDGAVAPDGGLAFLACAEDCPDATQDGPVSEVAFGRLDEGKRTFTVEPIIDEDGEPLLDKAEGLAWDPADKKRLFVVTDRDDAATPSDLLELRLS
ncbi:MAG: hypothetical protein KIT84_33635 [Labilithrix sp.]|nr:hypothetical protein [Labilithrix sp.]MCW5815990.1 hypothetical protein [Labilithrix sp.]